MRYQQRWSAAPPVPPKVTSSTIKHRVALGLADAMLAGAPTSGAVRERCARALGSDAAWLPALVRAALRRHARAWHWGSRRGLAQTVLDTPDFQAAWAGGERPILRYYFLVPPAMTPRPDALRHCALPDLPTPGAIARWLNVTPRELDWLADVRAWENQTRKERLRHYVHVWIAKRSGSHRLLEIPKPRLRSLQRRILHELLDHVPPHESVHGFRPGYSCLSNAALHVGRDVVVRMDLQDFFVSVAASRVNALLHTLGYPLQAARVLTGLCTSTVPAWVFDVSPGARGRADLPALEWAARKRYQAPHLPQGAPTSPALANLCAFRLDVRLKAAAETFGARYTRYADDLAFSGGHELARAAWRFVALVGAIALEEGFSINFRKTRVMTRATRQQVTGVVVNDKLNGRRDEYDRLKATLHNCLRFGAASQNRGAVADFRAHLGGRVAHAASLNASRGRRLRALFDQIDWGR